MNWHRPNNESEAITLKRTNFKTKERPYRFFKADIRLSVFILCFILKPVRLKTENYLNKTLIPAL
jgi:hypothetical protein